MVLTCIFQAGAEIIPASQFRVPSGSTRKGAAEYIVNVAKRGKMPNSTIGIVFRPSVRQLAGKAVVFSAEMRCTDIASDAAGDHIGGKILVSYQDGEGMRYFASGSLTGTSADWTKYSCGLDVPADARDLTVTFGIQQGWGTLEIRNPDWKISAAAVRRPKPGIQNFVPKANGEPITLTPNMFDLGKFASEKGDGIVVTVPETPGISNATRGAVLRLNTKSLLGKKCTFRAEVRTSGVATDARNPFWGGKILMVHNQISGTRYDGSSTCRGTSDWQEISCSFKPETAQTANATFGIQQGWGTIEFRNITLEISEPENAKFIDVELPADFRCEYTPEVANAPMRRGFMSPPPANLSEQDIRDLGNDWNANLLRYQIGGNLAEPSTPEAYYRWLNGWLDKLDSLMPLLAEKNIAVIIDMHAPPGARYQVNSTNHKDDPQFSSEPVRFRMMDDPVYRDAFINSWKMIARRYKGNPNIYGYDLMNEPSHQKPAKFNWLQLQYDAAKAIREIDETTPIIIENNGMCSPLNFFDITPLPLKNIIYQHHMYFPIDYTHQGCGESAKEYAAVYPQKSFDYRDRNWNRERLVKVLGQVRDFQEKYGARILVGEFSAIAWAPGAANYLDDVISIFEDYKWDWCYHAFREWDGWSLELDGAPDKLEASEKNPRKDVILKYLKLNKNK